MCIVSFISVMGQSMGPYSGEGGVRAAASRNSSDVIHDVENRNICFCLLGIIWLFGLIETH